MKILMIDDDARKIAKLVALLTASNVPRDAIDVARTAASARELLRKNRYDVVVLDLLLPNRDEDQARLETSLELLREMADRDELQKPERLIGFTAFKEAEAQAAPEFREKLWTIVTYDETTNEWEEQFRRVVSYVCAAHRNPAPAEYQIDVCVVTALQTPEMDAIHRLPWAWEPSEPMDDSTFVRRGLFESGGEKFRVVTSCAPRMGSVAAALLTSRLIDRFHPRFIVMGGICAGVRQKVNFGDVVLFSPSWEWASGKIVADGEGSLLEPAPHQLPVSEFVLARAEELRRDQGFWMTVKNEFPSESEVVPKLVLGPGASGPAVVAHKESSDAIQLQHRKLTAIDMEGYGVSAAAHSASSPKPTAFVVKGVSDFADEEKDEKWRLYAAHTSAQTIRCLFERYMAGMRDLAGT